jgi:predicted nucleotidyltransferase
MYGNPRATKDIDFLVANNSDNLAKLQKALLAFGSPPVDMERFREKGHVIRLGSSPIQIDIINEADGIDINECYLRKETIKVEDIDIFVISKDDLIKNKTASGRSMDIADAEKLKKSAT